VEELKPVYTKMYSGDPSDSEPELCIGGFEDFKHAVLKILEEDKH
jgi:hypothetical protein